MGYKLGLDFGTTNSTVSYVDESGKLLTFRYPGPSGNDYIPSCVSYTKSGKSEVVRVGREGLRVAGGEQTKFHKDMKMVLPRPKEEWDKMGWKGNRSPEEVITEYLNRILLSDKRRSYSFKKEVGDIEGIIVSVPQSWLTRQPNHKGRPLVEKIVKENLKLPLIHLISEPVAAAAYYGYWYKQKKAKDFKGNLLVCDMGGGTFDVTLCKLTDNKVEVLKNDGNGIFDLGKAGVHFDTKLLQKAYKNEKGKDLEIGSNNFYRLYKQLQEYKVDCAEYITENIETARRDPSYAKKLPIIENPFICYMDDIDYAFSEVKNGIDKVLGRIININEIESKSDNLKRIKEEEKVKIDKVILVGGFNEFELTRTAIKDFLTKNKDFLQGDLEFIDDISSGMSAKAISLGAALIANNLFNVEELYPHTIGIVVDWKEIQDNKKNNETKLINKKNYIPLINGRKKISDYKLTNYYKDYLLAYGSMPKLTIYIKPGSGESIAEKEIPKSADIQLPNFFFGNRWKVGMKLNDSQIAYIVFQDEIKNEESESYEIGDIFTQMFGLDGLILSED